MLPQTVVGMPGHLPMGMRLGLQAGGQEDRSEEAAPPTTPVKTGSKMPFLRFVQPAHGSRMGAWPLSSLGEDQPWCPSPGSAPGLPQPLSWRGEETGSDFLWGAVGGGQRLEALRLRCTRPPVLSSWRHACVFPSCGFHLRRLALTPPFLWACTAPPCAHRGPQTLKARRGLEGLFSAFGFICVRPEPQGRPDTGHCSFFDPKVLGTDRCHLGGRRACGA